MFDGGKAYQTRVLSPWKPQSATKKKKEDQDEVREDDDAKTTKTTMLQVVKTEDSILARKKLVRGTMSIKQIEGIHVVSHNEIVLPERAWTHYPGSNNGDTISG